MRSMRQTGGSAHLLATIVLAALATGAAPVRTGEEAAASYTCAPCGCDFDGKEHDGPGRCPSCGMPLVKKEDVTEVAILVFPGVQIIDFAGPYEVFGQNPFHVFTVSEDGKPLTTAMNLTIDPAYSFEEAPRPDVVVVPGGHVHDVERNDAVLDWLKRSAEGAQHVLSVCNGAFLLARAGLLEGKSATTFYGLIDELQSIAPGTRVVRDQRFVDNGKVITSAGLSSGIDASLHLVGKMRGEATARHLALHLEYQWDPGSDFARAALADLRYPDMDLPDDIRLEMLETGGDRDGWERRYRVYTGRTLAELMEEVRTQVARSDSFVEKSIDVRPERATARWTFLDEDRRPWEARLSLLPEDKGAFLSAFQVKRTGDRASHGH